MRLCLFDLDRTLLDGRTLLTLAKRFDVHHGLARAMGDGPCAGTDETQRVMALFAGVDAAAFRRACGQTPLRPGAVAAVGALRRQGFRCGIATASYEPAAQAVADRLGMEVVAAVRPEELDGRITGTAQAAWPGDCGRAVCKAEALEAWRHRTGAKWACAVGDGVNDVCMFKKADLAVALEPCAPEARDAADLVVPSLRHLPRILDQGTRTPPAR